LGSAPMVGFGAMVRPDVTADLLGFAGFLVVVVWGGRWRLVLGGLLLVVAVFTKQTAGLYTLAAVLALAWSGRRSATISLAVGTAVASLVILFGVTWTIEPNFTRDFFGESGTPIALEDWLSVLKLLVQNGPEILTFLVAGLVIWLGRHPREVPFAALALVLTFGSLLAALKSGADQNYFLGLRLVAALGAGAVWAWIYQQSERIHVIGWARCFLLGVVLVASLAILRPSYLHMAKVERKAQNIGQLMETQGRIVLRDHRQLFALAANPGVPILTDSGLVALHQRQRAPFVDPWLFRVLVTSGRIDPKVMVHRLQTTEYEWIITTHDLFDPNEPYDDYVFGLPPEVAEYARRNYAPAGQLAGRFLYRPITGPVPTSTHLA